MAVVHITFGSTDLVKGGAFYDAVVGAYGGKRAFTKDGSIGWALPDGGPSIGICLPFDGQPANFGNGTMIAMMATSEDQVRRVHAAALANGGTCEGTPGLRDHGLYAAYFRDPDGNKMNSIAVPGS